MKPANIAPITNPGLWRRIATGAHDIAHLDPADQPALRGYAWAMLKQDHARRLGRSATPAPAAPCQIVPLTTGHTPRHRLTITPKTEPEDAA